MLYLEGLLFYKSMTLFSPVKMNNYKRWLVLLFLFFITFILCFTIFGNLSLNLPMIGRKVEPKIWLSMSVCFGENAQIHGKGQYPYTYAATLSSRLWREVSDGEVNVLLTIVYNNDVNNSALEEYVESFDGVEGVLIRREQSVSFGCVLQSQLSRIFAFDDEIMNDDDIILTTDVDLFVMDNRILEPLRRPFLTWIYEYELTQSFRPQSFIMSIVTTIAGNSRTMFLANHET